MLHRRLAERGNREISVATIVGLTTCQFTELCDAQALGAQSKEGMFFTLFEEREGGTKRVPNGFPALIESGFNHFGKEGLITVQSLD